MRTFVASCSCSLLAVLLSTACGPSVESVTEEHRAASQARIDTITKAAADAKERPPVKATKLESPLEGPLVISNDDAGFDTGVVLLPMIDEPCQEAIMLGEGSVHDADAIRLDHAGFPSGPDEWFRDPACLLKQGQPAPGRRLKQPEHYQTRFAKLEGLKYVAIVRYHDYVQPKVLGDAVSATRYGSGRVEGDVLLYDAKDGRYLGGTPLRITSSSETSTNPGGAIHSATDAVLTDFRRRTDEAIGKAVVGLGAAGG